METISMLEFRQRADDVLQRIRNGERLILTYRGKPVARLQPIEDQPIHAEDPFYHLTDLAADDGDSLTNEEMDAAIYGT